MNLLPRLGLIVLMSISQVKAAGLPNGLASLLCKSPTGLSFKLAEGSNSLILVSYAGATRDFKLASPPRFIREDLTSSYPFKVVRKQNFTNIEMYNQSNTLYDGEYYNLEFDGNILQSKKLDNISGVARKSIIPYGIGRTPINSPEVSVKCSMKFTYDAY
jgi:hypothetical protein